MYQQHRAVQTTMEARVKGKSDPITSMQNSEAGQEESILRKDRILKHEQCSGGEGHFWFGEWLFTKLLLYSG